MDTFVVAHRPQRAWPALVARDLFLIGTGGGLLCLAVLLPSFGLVSGSLAVWSGWFGLGLIGAAGLVLLADLGAPSRSLQVFRRPRRRWLSRRARNMLLLGIFGLVVWLSALPELKVLPSQREALLGAALGAIVVVLALSLMTYTGLLLISWNAIPFWKTPLLPVLFVTSALLSAAGALLVVAVLTDAAGGLTTLTLTLIVVLSFHLGLYLMVMRTASATARPSTRLLFSGSESWAFLGGVIVAGPLAPAVLLLFDLAFGFRAAGTSLVAAVAILVGVIQFRRMLRMAGVYHA